MKIERRYKQPTPPHLRKRALGVKGGAVVLMVAALENFLKELVEERLAPLSELPLKFKPEILPYKMRKQNALGIVEAIKYRTYTDDNERITELEVAAAAISNRQLIPQSFTEVTRTNPSPDRVKKLFKSLGIKDIFTYMKSDFEAAWGSPVASTFIHDTLDTVISTRHIVAHSATGLNIARADLWNWLQFLRIFGKMCDKSLARHVRNIIKGKI